MINLEPLTLVYLYFARIERKNFVFDIVLPLVISLFIYFLSRNENSDVLFSNYINPMQPILGVFIGFNIMVITVLTTSNSESINQIKTTNTRIGKGKKDTLFNILLLNFVYSIFVEIVLLLLIFSLPLLYKTCYASSLIYHLTFGIFFWTFIHILFLTIRNITNFYFSLIDKKHTKKY